MTAVTTAVASSSKESSKDQGIRRPEDSGGFGRFERFHMESVWMVESMDSRLTAGQGRMGRVTIQRTSEKRKPDSLKVETPIKASIQTFPKLLELCKM